jgi:hypothetical protein
MLSKHNDSYYNTQTEALQEINLMEENNQKTSGLSSRRNPQKERQSHQGLLPHSSSSKYLQLDESSSSTVEYQELRK